MKRSTNPLLVHLGGCLTLAGLASLCSAQTNSTPDWAVDLEPDRTSLSKHYARAGAELREASVDHLIEDQRARRSLALDWLEDYRQAADFGVNDLAPGRRSLYFVDEGGRRCAVAWLMEASGHGKLVQEVAGDDNQAFVAELGWRPGVQTWLLEHGLTLDEAARIQGPAMGGPTVSPPPPATWNGPGDRVPAPSEPSSPATPGSSRPNTPAPSGPSSAPPSGGPSTPGPGGPQNPNSPASMPGPSTYTVGPEVWMTWWELHKMDYLRPNLLKNWHGTVTQWKDDGSNPLDQVRTSVLPHLIAALKSEDARLRASAAVALGRMAGRIAIPHLVELLRDPSHEVRERSLLALGATGSMEAAELLLDISETGATKGERNISPDARSMAVLALAIGRRNGMSAYVDHALHEQLKAVSGTDRFLVQSAGLLYHTMNPGPVLRSWAQARASDEHTALGVRCRALETLRTCQDSESLAVLLHHLSGRSLEMRRSAALALGEFEHDMALAPLLTAAELEKEPLTRAFVLISIGRQGGDQAEAFLMNYLEEGAKASRSWAALALGIATRQSSNPKAMAALRDGLLREKNREYRGAYYLALGISQDIDARAVLIDALRNGSSYEIRSGAAMGLGMLADDQGIAALREQLSRDKCEYTRAAIAEAIGFQGDYNDSVALIESWSGMKVPENQADTALALGLHGQRKSVEAMIAVLEDPKQDARKRAAAIDSLQVVLGRAPSLAVGELLRQSNFLVYPPPLIKIREVLL